MSEHQFGNVFWGHSHGVLLVTPNGINWRSKTTEAFKRLGKDDIVSIRWASLGKNCYLKIFQKGGKMVKFHGLVQADVDVISKHSLQIFDVKVEKEKVSCGGGNWGEMKIEGGLLNFWVNDSSSMEIPLEVVSQCARAPGKNEVELHFHEDDTVADDEETLVEMRIYVPPGEDELVAAETFQREILEQANISTVTGQAIVELDETIGTFLTPRGRYAVELYPTFLRMHGKTYDYKIMYSNINRCFLLERPDGVSFAFIISLEEPIRQGKQGYPHLVLQLRKEDTDGIDVNLSSEELKKYDGNLSGKMSGSLPQVVATLFKFLIQKKVYTSGKFKTHIGDRAVKCALKAMEGYLYPLEKSFMFIHKPTTFIRFEEIDYVEFQRYAGQSGTSASRNFDLLVMCRSVGGEPGKEYIFSAIDRREFPELSQFLASKKLKIHNLKEAQQSSNTRGGFNEYLDALGPEEGEIDEEDEEDSDFGPAEDSGSSGASLSGSGGESNEDDDEEAKSDYSSNGEDDDDNDDDDDDDDEKVSSKKEKKKKEKKEKKEKSSKKRKSSSSEKKKGKSKKKKKDPNAPKRAKTAFILFSNSRRQDIMKENPGIKVTEVSKILGEEWKSMKESDKEEWNSKAEVEKERYKSEIDAYTLGKSEE